MKIRIANSKLAQAGIALALVLIMSALALLILGSIISWSSTSVKLTQRSIQYTRSVAAAEAATEKVVSQMSQDFLTGGANLVNNNLNAYRQNTAPTATDSAYFAAWQFDDGNGNIGQTYVQQSQASTYQVLGSTYAGLQGYVTTYTVVSHASDITSSQSINAGVYQELQLTGIPIFQFAMYSSDDMEISCGEPFSITGPVHSNGQLFVEPDNALTFDSGVTAVTDILFQREPLDTRGPPAGTVVYENTNEVMSPVNALTLPIGTNNSPLAIRQIIEPPLPGEDASSALGQERYYNLVDMVVTVSDTGVSATSGSFNSFATPILTNDLSLFISTNASFYDPRQGQTVMPVDINITNLVTWSETNITLNAALGNARMTSIYVNDTRNLPTNELAAVRVYNGLVLPTNGLTVATGDPLYIQGDYNELNTANLGTSNTSATRPASFAADAITILSDSWSDTNSSNPLSDRNASDTTVNAAFLTGVVETTLGNYSGGMENFPRFLETWGSAVFTYNGSMVKMFPSQWATGVWGQANVYVPPTRNWAYDVNFNDPTKLPPLTPSLLNVIRSRWSTAAPGQNVALTGP